MTEKLEIRSSKFEANSNFKNRETEAIPDPVSGFRSGKLFAISRFEFRLSHLFRTSDFEFRLSNLVPHLRGGFWGLLLGLSCWSTRADTILASKHDLSSSGPGTIKATAESDVCGFCHTPHRGVGETPLWNHAMSTASYIPYSSSTTKATIGQPTGCLQALLELP